MPVNVGIPGIFLWMNFKEKYIKLYTNVELNMIFDISPGLYEECKNVSFLLKFFLRFLIILCSHPYLV